MPKTANSAEKAKRESLNLKDEQIKQLTRLFPEVVADGKVNWEKLKAILGETVDTSFEKFSFTWAEKGEAIRNVLVPSKATLRPDKKASIQFDQGCNIFIEGDNLEVLKLLQNAYFESIKAIYIDPPYNQGNDAVYKDDYRNSIKNYLEQTGQNDNDGNSLQTNTETSGRFHSNWLNMMYPRLKLAWNLLRDNGVIFINIGNRELHHLLLMMNEIYGEENFVETLIWRKKSGGGQQDDFFVTEHDYIVCYAKNKSAFNLNEKKVGKSIDEYKLHDKKKVKRYKQVKLSKWGSASLREDRPTMHFPLINPDGKKTYPIAPDGRPGRWRYGRMRVKELIDSDSIDWEKRDGVWVPYEKQYAPESGDLSVLKERSILYDLVENTEGANELTEIFGIKDVFQNPKPSDLISHLLLFSTQPDSGDIVLDFFAGSCSTAHAVLNLNGMDKGNRRFMVVQLPELLDDRPVYKKFGFKTIADIGKERIRRVISGYGEEPQSIKDGFKVFKLSPSSYPENKFEYDPEKSEKENENAYKTYLEKAGQLDLFSKVNEIDLVYENMIKEGLDLNSKITEISLGKNKVFQAKDEKSEIMVCLDSQIADATVKALSSDNYKDKIFVCYDKAVDDSAKANLGLHLSLRSI